MVCDELLIDAAGKRSERDCRMVVAPFSSEGKKNLVAEVVLMLH